MEILQLDKFRLKYQTYNKDIINAIGGIQTTKPNIKWVPVTIMKLQQVVDTLTSFKVDQNVIDPVQELLDTMDSDRFFLNGGLNADDPADSRLRPYQAFRVECIKEKHNYGLFMEQRTGKTPTAIVAIKDAPKIIVAVPAGLEQPWVKEWSVWGDRQDIIHIKGTFSLSKKWKAYNEFKQADRAILVVSIDTIGRHAYNRKLTDKKTIKSVVDTDMEAIFKYGKGFEYDYLVVDEAHFMRNRTLKSLGMGVLRKMAKNCLALTGTPATNKPEDAIPIIMLLNQGKYTKWGLIEYFFYVERGQFATEVNGVRENMLEEWAEFLELHSGIEKQRDVMKWLPEVIQETIEIDFTPAQTKVQNQLKDNFRFEDEDGDIVRVENVLTQYIKFRQLNLDPAIIGATGKSLKVDWLKNYLTNNPDEPTIIWSDSKKYIYKLEQQLAKWKPLIITGDNRNQRNMLKEQFQSGMSNLIIAKIDTLNVGHTLDRANTMIFTDRNWSTVEMEQAYSRFLDVVDRGEDKKVKMIYHLHINNSIDDLVREANINKLNNTQIVNNFEKWLLLK